MSWQKVTLGNILERKKNLIEIEDDKDYKLVTVKLYHRGVTLRKVVKGNELSSKKMHSVKEGEFILSGIDARHGAFGIIPKELEGAVVSNDFWCLSFDKSLIEKHFFLRLTGTAFFDDLCKKASDGTTNRVRLQADKFFNLEISIPPIEEQKQFVERYNKIEEVNSSISTELNHQLAFVKELRQAYLREAMQGKLVPQNEREKPAQVLLEKIRAEKERLIKEKKIKKEKPLPPMKPEEIPFEIPANWVWCRLVEAFNFIDYRGRPPTKTEKGIRLITAKNIRMGYIDNNPVEFISESLYEKWMTRGFPKNGDLLFVTEGHTMGFVAKVDLDFLFALAQRTINLQPYLSCYSAFIFFLIMSPQFQNQIKVNATGSAATGIQSAKLKQILIPFPPLAEQERIVAKLEKLMKFCDELETNIKQGITNADLLLQVALKEALQGNEKNNFLE